MRRSEVLQILEKFKNKQAKKYGILTLGIFGSVARNQSGEKSDVDIFLKTQTPDPFILVHIKEELESQLHRHVDIVRLRKKMNPFLKKRIEKDAVYV